MSMTKKDFEGIAALLKKTEPGIDKPSAAFEIWNSLRHELADFCAKQNPAFNRHRFMEACRATT